ncbi:hypothetical protein X777_13171 [Ooceraea biroi]|uniref:Uncharacterized protein n=1 Tax=Ooceraea biroi TaxID=2015173 RepID=A0A026VYZ6_OOCBI|nr:hypothetical protein X777_13171 [Ooceraea biroi]
MVRGTGSQRSSSGSSSNRGLLFRGSEDVSPAKGASPIAPEHLQCDTIMRIKRAPRSSWPREPEEVPSLCETFRETQRQE